MTDTAEITKKRAAQEAASGAIEREFRHNTTPAGIGRRRSPVLMNDFLTVLSGEACKVRDALLGAEMTDAARYDAGCQTWEWLDAIVLRADGDPRLTDEDHWRVREAVMRALGIYPELANPKPGDRFPNGDVCSPRPDAATVAAEVAEIRKRKAAEAREATKQQALLRKVAELELQVAAKHRELEAAERGQEKPCGQAPDPVSEERRREYFAYVNEVKARTGRKLTQEQFAAAASPTWHDRTVLGRWLRNNPRSTPAEDAKIRNVLRDKPHLTTGSA